MQAEPIHEAGAPVYHDHSACETRREIIRMRKMFVVHATGDLPRCPKCQALIDGDNGRRS
jgi:hypothetical protein